MSAKWNRPPKVTDLDLAFGGGAMKWLPPWSAIPEDFKHDRTPWNQQVGIWFFRGPDKEWIRRLVPREGVDKSDALRAAQACLHSFEPKHEHKEAGVAYLLSLWFTDPNLGAPESTP